MALDAATVWEVQTGGSDNNGGGFVAGASGTDRSQGTSAHATLSTSSVVNATTTIIDVAAGDYTCTDADVGNILQITGGTATAGYYEITARSAQQWTLDRSAGTAGQTVVGNMGGCLATPGELAGALEAHGVTGMICWIKSGTYSLSTSTVAASGGPFGHNAGTWSISFQIEGYETTRGDRGAKPVLDAAAQTGLTLWELSTSGRQYGVAAINLKADGQDNATVIGFESATGHIGAILCEAVDCPTGFKGVLATACKASSCATYGFQNGITRYCHADACGTGFYRVGEQSVYGPMHCIASNGTTGFTLHRGGNIAFCCAYNCSGDGFAWSDSGGVCAYCVATECGAYGFDGISGNNTLLECYDYSNTSGRADSSIEQDIGGGTLTADPFVDAALGDFNFNNTAGGGAVLRALTLTP